MKQLLLIACTVVACMSTNAQPGTLDRTFGEGGTLLADSLYTEFSAQLKDGRVLFGNGGEISSVFPDGKKDLSFGVNGVVTFKQDYPYYFYGFNVTEQQDGKIVVTGSIYNGLALYRYNRDGTPDETFGDKGRTTTFIEGDIYPYALVVQPDGKIVVTGTQSQYYIRHPLLVRYNNDGVLDKGFGKEGIYITPSKFDECCYQTGPITGGECLSIALQKDGKIVTAGYNTDVNRTFMVMRFTKEGLPDSSFSDEGIASDNYIGSPYDFAYALAIQPDGKILAAGSDGRVPIPIGSNFGVMRFNINGTLDESYGKGGKVSISTGDYSIANACSLQSNGKLVVGGFTYGDKDPNYAIARLMPDGSFDVSFGDSGTISTDIRGYDKVLGLYIQKDGKILAAGNSNYSEDDKSVSNASLARYLGDPINLITKATIKRWIKNHILNWQATVSNNDISYYAIERSQSGTAGFTQIAKVKANKVQPNAATATYAYNLASNAAANSTTTNYYRIRAVNTDGSFVYSDVVSDAGLQTGSGFTVSPNPARDVLKVSGLPANEKTVVNIVNRNGNVLQTVTAQSSAISINVSALHSGVYNINTVINGKVQSVQFVKE